MSYPNFIQVGSDISGTSYNTKLSLNGIVWTDSSNNQFTLYGQDAAYGTSDTTINPINCIWVMVGIDASGNTIKYSDNEGVTWQDASNCFSGFYGNGSGICWGKDNNNNYRWIVVGGDGNPPPSASTSNTIKYSSDGNIWQNAINPFQGGTSGGVFYPGSGNGVNWGVDINFNSMWVTVGTDFSGNNIKYSYDGITWLNANNSFGLYGNGVANGLDINGKPLWVAVGNDSISNIKYSNNGINWSNANNSFGLYGNGVSWGIDNNSVGVWVAVGNDNSGNTIKYSYNGFDWLNANNGFTGGSTGSGYTVVWGKDNNNNPIWIAGGSDNYRDITTKYSYNGIQWIDTSNNTIIGTVVGVGSRYKSPLEYPNKLIITRAFYLLKDGTIVNEFGNTDTTISLEIPNQPPTCNNKYVITSLPNFQLYDGSTLSSYTPSIKDSVNNNTIMSVPYDLSGDSVNFVWAGSPYFGKSEFSFKLTTNIITYQGEVIVYLLYDKQNGCDTGYGPYPTRVWSRASDDCVDLSGAVLPTGQPMTYDDLSEKRKAVIFQYKNNSAGFSKKQHYSRLARGLGRQRGQTFATQSQSYTNPNTHNLVVDNSAVLLCPGVTKNWALTNENDTPGPLRRITNYPTVPLTNYKVRRTYLAGGTKWPQYAWATGMLGFPIGKAGHNK